MADFDHIVFKNQDGVFYGVSQRVIDLGYQPPEGTVKATKKETTAFLKKVSSPPSGTVEEALSKLKELNVDPATIKLMTGIEVEG